MEEKKFKTFGDLEESDDLFVFNENNLTVYKTIFGNYPYKETLEGYNYVEKVYDADGIQLVATSVKILIEYASDLLCNNIRSAERRIANHNIEIAGLKRTIDNIQNTITLYKNCLNRLKNYEKEFKEQKYIDFIRRYNNGETRRYNGKFGDVKRIYKIEMENGGVDVFKTILNIGNDVFFNDTIIKNKFMTALNNLEKDIPPYIMYVNFNGCIHWAFIDEDTLQKIIEGVSSNN